MKEESIIVILKPYTVRQIERLAGEKITNQGDEVINKALDNAVLNGNALKRLRRKSSYYGQF